MSPRYLNSIRPSLHLILSFVFTVLILWVWNLFMVETVISASVKLKDETAILEAIPPIIHNASLIVQLGGEMGNFLSMISVGLVLRRIARTHGIQAEIVLMRYDRPKFVRTKKVTQQCFINTRSMNFEAANTREFDHLARAQEKWLEKDSTRLYINNTHTIDDIHRIVKYWKSVLDRTDRPQVQLDNYSPIAVPYLFVKRYIENELLDSYFDEILNFFLFDYEKCCKLRAHVDETVLHMRLYTTEQPGLTAMEELSPSKVATELFGSNNHGENITILSRFNDHHVEPYKYALDLAGFQAKVLSGQKGVEDFCYLMSAKKELVGIEHSSYFKFAAVLGNATKVRSYLVESPHTVGERFHGFDYEWTHPLLKKKMTLEKYKSEEQDRLENRTKNSIVQQNEGN